MLKFKRMKTFIRKFFFESTPIDTNFNARNDCIFFKSHSTRTNGIDVSCSLPFTEKNIIYKYQ